MAQSSTGTKKKTTTKKTDSNFAPTPEERNRFGVSTTGPIDQRTIQAILDDREATQIADAWGLPAGNPPTKPSVSSSGGKGGSSSGSAGGSAMSKILAAYAKKSLGNIGADLNAATTQISNLGQQARTRYDDYLAKLNAANTTAQGNITAAQNALLASIPQTATANPVVFQQPAATSNVYGEYLRSMGLAAPEVASMQAYNTATANAANSMAQQAAAAQQAAQQQYLDNLRATATMAGTAANQRLAAQMPAYQAAALKTYQDSTGALSKLLAEAQSGSATTRQKTLDALLPILLQYPSAYKQVLAQFGGQ